MEATSAELTHKQMDDLIDFLNDKIRDAHCIQKIGDDYWCWNKDFPTEKKKMEDVGFTGGMDDDFEYHASIPIHYKKKNYVACVFFYPKELSRNWAQIYDVDNNETLLNISSECTSYTLLPARPKMTIERMRRLRKLAAQLAAH